MKKFLYKLLKFSIVPLLLIIGVELFIQMNKNNLLNEENLESQFLTEANQYTWINNLNEKPIRVLAGSSSVKYSLSCTKLTKLSDDKFQYVNIAEDARDPIVTYYILKSLNLKNIEAVYFGLDPWIYTKSYYKHRNDIFYSDLNLLQAIRFNSEHNNSTLKKRLTNVLTKPSNSSPKNYIIPKDFGTVILKQNPTNFKNPKDWFQVETYGWSKIQFEYLRKIKLLCQKNKIDFFVFIPPKRSDFTLSYKKECWELHNEFNELLEEYNINSFVFGKYTDLENVGDKINFADAFHLNERGQRNYSKLFYKMSNSKSNSLNKKYDWF
ncbi:MAG: hypothetical protein ACK476_05095 [Fluviicola sp.]|jgi:hypothetical protein